MKTNPSSPNSKRRGVALVLVLSFVVLLTALIVATFTTATNDYAASKGYADSSRVQQLADTAVNLVMAQIREATTQRVSQELPAVWASQPGLITTWSGNSGTPSRYFKLYSSGTMVSSTWNAAGEIAAQWWNSPNRWVDLNAPIVLASGTAFPILDPTIKYAPGSFTVTNFDAPEGFEITAQTNTNTGSPLVTPASMPVQWLYVLRSGSISAMGAGNTVTGASANDPIVGRIAFWTDDETAKVNINTASEGVFWDFPKAEGRQEREMGRFQPAKDEFNRYPGHPAMTSLSAVFPMFKNVPQSQWDQIYDLVPRVGWGGSRAGTQQPNPPTDTITKDQDRLYATVDEYLFSPLRGLANSQIVPQQHLKKSSFFLTAASRAPEVNLLGRPRVSMWPIHTGTNKQDAFDRALAFCATTQQSSSAKLPYYFQRQNPLSPKEDYDGIARNGTLYNYLKRMTDFQLPGYPRSLAEKFGADRDQILTMMFDYIRSGPNLLGAGLVSGGAFNLGYTPGPFNQNTGLVVPIEIGSTRGFGRSVTVVDVGIGFFCEGIDVDESAGTTTYSIRPHLLLETYTPACSWETFMPDLNVRVASSNLGVSGTSGSPSYAVTFTSGTCRMARRSDSSNDGTLGPSFSPQLFLVQDLRGNSAANRRRDGSSGDQGREFLLRSETTYNFTVPTPIKPNTSPARSFNASELMTPNGTGILSQNNFLATFDTSTDPQLRFQFNGGTVQLEVLTANGHLMQTVNVEFPSISSLPLPSYRTDDSTMRSNFSTVINQPYATRFALPNGASLHPINTGIHIQQGDVVRSLELTGDQGTFGDWRLAFLSGTVPSSWFAPYDLNTYQSGTMQWHTLRNVWGSPHVNHAQPWIITGTTARLVENTKHYQASKYPYTVEARYRVQCTSANLNGTKMSNGFPGDFDNNYGGTVDGPFINRPDTGALGQMSSGTRNSYFTSLYVPGGGITDEDQFRLLYSPNRQMYSPIQFGSLPARFNLSRPWETLLFCPNPAAGRDNHPGWTETPPDHLWADLFFMPVVDPYPISEPFSTAGKININYQIAPFSYIQRKTGMHALLKATKITAIDARTVPVDMQDGGRNNGSLAYKGMDFNDKDQNFRYPINVEETLKGMDAALSIAPYRSATQICEVFLYPPGVSYTSNETELKNWWTNQVMTGDNSREQPYAHILPRATTKSNTFTVHYRVQTLQKAKGTPANEWVDNRDMVVAESRGSTTIERYIDPNPPIAVGQKALPDFAATDSVTDTNGDDVPDSREVIEDYYRFRVLYSKRFDP